MRQELLARGGERPTALLAGNDTIALGAMAAITDAGLSVPDDIAIVGFDDLPFAAQLRPALTTVRNPGVEQGRQAAQLLIRLLKGEPIAQRRIALPTEADHPRFLRREPAETSLISMHFG